MDVDEAIWQADILISNRFSRLIVKVMITLNPKS